MKVVVTKGLIDNSPYEYVATIRSVEKYKKRLFKFYVGYKFRETDNGITCYHPTDKEKIVGHNFYTDQEWEGRFNENK